MPNRHKVVVVLCTGMMLLTGLRAVADDAKPPADALLKQGISQLNQGQSAQAASIFARIDPLQLGPDDRVRLGEAIASARKQLQSTSNPSAMLDDAQNAYKTGALDEAARLYQAVVKHTHATNQQKLKAATNLAGVRRRQTPQLTKVRRLIDEADGDIKAGRFDAASRKIQQVRQANTDMGWFENDRLDRLSMALAEQQAAGRAPGANAMAMASPSSAAAWANIPSGNDQTSPPATIQVTDGATVEVPISASATVTPTQALATSEQPGIGLLSQIRGLALQEKLSSARAAEQNQQYNLAVQFYQRALELDPANEEAKAGLTTAQVKVNQTTGPQGPLADVTGVRRLVREAALADFMQLINKAESLRQDRNYPGAKEAVQQAKIRLDRNRRTLPADEFKAKREQANQLAAAIDTEQLTWDEENRKSIEENNRRDTMIERDKAHAETARQVELLLVRARDLRREQKYERALELINQALFHDPQNFAASAMKEMIQDSLFYMETRKHNERYLLESRHNTLAAHEARIPYTDLLTFPAEWPELTRRRLAGLEEDSPEAEINRRVEAKLREPVPINFENNTLVNVIDYLRNTTGLNFYTNWTALQNIGVEQDYPITLQLSNIPANQAMELILTEASAGNEFDPLDYAVHQGIVKISTERELKRTTVVSRIYDIRDLLVTVRNFTGAPSFSVEGASGGGGSEGGGGGSVNLFGGDDDDDDDDDDDSDDDDDDDDSGSGASRSELVYQILDLVRQIGRPEDWFEFGGDVSSVRELNGNLIVRTTPDAQREILTLLSQLRETRAMQINVETRFLLVDNNFLEEVGIDIDLRATDPGGNFGAITVAQDSFNVAARPNTGITGSFGTALGNTGVAGLSSFVVGSGTGSGRSLDLGFSYLDDIEVAVLIRASQNHRRATQVTAPRLTFFNGQQAFIAVVRQIAFISDLTVIPDGAGFDPTIGVTQAGVVLEVEGTVSADRRFVTMTIEPGLGTVVQIRQITQTAVVNIEDPDTGDDTTQIVTGIIELPELELTELGTTVSVPDRGTLLLGGQRLIGEIEVEAGVPVLSKIPLLNRLFTNRSKTKDERTLLILIKPTIIIQTEEEEINFPGLRQNPAQFNIGRSSIN